jgi:hypothetical protein
MKLVHKRSGKLAKIGDQWSYKKRKFCLLGAVLPHKTSSEGRVCVRIEFKDGTTNEQEFYCSVAGLEWIEREDRIARPPEEPVQEHFIGFAVLVRGKDGRRFIAKEGHGPFMRGTLKPAAKYCQEMRKHVSDCVVVRARMTITANSKPFNKVGGS